MHAVLLFALEGYSRPGCFGKAVDVVSLDAKGLFDLPAHLLGPGLGAEYACLKLVFFGLIALLLERFAQIRRVRRRAAEYCGIEVHHELYLPVGVARRHGKRQRSNLVRAAVEPRAACEQAVAVGHLDDVLFGPAGRHYGPGAAVFPQIHVVLRIVSYDSLSGGAGGGLDAYAVLEGHRKHSVRIGLPKVVLGDERELLDVVQGLNVLGLYALLVHQRPVVRDVFVYVLYLFFELFLLERTYLLPGHSLDLFLIIPFFHEFFLST